MGTVQFVIPLAAEEAVAKVVNSVLERESVVGVHGILAMKSKPMR
jgi:hypothetical protein